MVSPSHDASDPDTFSQCIILAVYVSCTICHSYKKASQPFKSALAYDVMTSLLHPTNKQAVTNSTD